MGVLYPSASFIPPSRQEWDLMFQPVFDEFISPPACVASLVPVEGAPDPVKSTVYLPQQLAEEESHDLEVAHMSNDPYFCIPIPVTISEESLSSDVIPTTVNSNAPITKHLKSLKKYEMESCDLVDTLMVEKSKLNEDTQGKSVDLTHYLDMVGTLMYLTSSRPDLILIMRAVKIQDVVHLEMRSQLTDYGLGFNKIPMYCDNKSTTALCCNNVQHSRSKHINIRYHFIKEQVENGVVELYFVRTEYQLTDIFTKTLCRERIDFLIDKLGMRSFTLETLKELVDEAEE
nr:retrotransposon protein, putative, unclassified [Tanacetum cinerariifolium]